MPEVRNCGAARQRPSTPGALLDISRRSKLRRNKAVASYRTPNPAFGVLELAAAPTKSPTSPLSPHGQGQELRCCAAAAFYARRAFGHFPAKQASPKQGGSKLPHSKPSPKNPPDDTIRP